MPTGGADRLVVTFRAKGRTIGTTVVAAAGDPHPGELLRDEAMHRFADALHEARAALPPVLPALRATVLVCTADRPESLTRCLAAIGRLEGGPYEVLVVDNGRAETDATAAAVAATGARYVREPVPGLDRARNRGVADATGDVVLCTDDDVEVHPAWAESLLGCFADPLVMAATGLVLPARLDTPARRASERWASHGRGARRRDVDGTSVDPMAAGSLGNGASMAFRTAFLRGVGGFPPELDAGTPTRSGGDTWGLFRVLLGGYRIAYEPAALAFHLHREDDGALRAAIRGYGTGYLSFAARAALSGRGAPPVAVAGAARRLVDLGKQAIGASLGLGSTPPRHLAFGEIAGAAAAIRAFPASRREAARLGGGPSFDGCRLPAPWLDAYRPGPPHRGVAPLPAISIVIPTRGRRERVVALLDALDRQQYAGEVEVIVVVDGDVDGTAPRVRGRCGARCVSVVVLDENRGPGIARNRGAAIARHDVLLFLDDDVLPVHDGVLLAHGRRHDGTPAAVVGPCPVDLRDTSSLLEQRLRSWWTDHAGAMATRAAAHFTDVCSGNLSVDRATFERIGGFADLPRREDWELGHVLISAGVPVTVAADAGTPQVYADTTIDKVLADRRREGAGDAELVRRHPELLGALPVRAWRTTERRISFLAVCITAPAVLAPVVTAARAWLRLLDLTGRRARHGRVLQWLSKVTYWRGVGEASGGLTAWEAIADEAELLVATPGRGEARRRDGRDVTVWRDGRALALVGADVEVTAASLAWVAVVADAQERWA